jgi:hypothetical protein
LNSKPGPLWSRLAGLVLRSASGFLLSTHALSGFQSLMAGASGMP